jgi:2-isopropylmalate synthase
MAHKIQIYDTTLRDGAQREGISFSIVDKIHIAQKLDELGIHYIEGGWPGSNPKDTGFFSKISKIPLANSRIVAFGATRKPKNKAVRDTNLLTLRDSQPATVALVGKSSLRQVKQVLQTTPAENLLMISDSISYLCRNGKTVFFDAEHYFDGFKADKQYALDCLRAAAEAGASLLVLCDTNGGTVPEDVIEGVQAACEIANIQIGIHAHNDCGLAIANSLAAVKAGATQIQGTIKGYGERCGNANLCAVIPNLKLKMGIDCVTDEQLSKLVEVSRYVSELANLTPDPFMPYVGTSAFSHKGGFHVSGMTKWGESYQHIAPAKVGNQSKVTVSELSGKQNIIVKSREFGIDLSSREEGVQRLLDEVKTLESLGSEYEQAEASFELLIRRAKRGYRPPFKLVDYLVIVEKRRRPPSRKRPDEILSEAIVKVTVDDELIHTAAEGNGPVNALDVALRKALLHYYSSLAKVKLMDYKVRILEESVGTGSQVRVLIESSDGENEWRTVGSSTNIIEASWLALADSFEYWLIKYAGISR